MKIPFKYTIKNFTSRKLTTFITIFGVALVVFVFAAVLMMAYGIQKTLIATGLPDNVLITRKAANGEISSIIEGEVRDVIRTLTHIATNKDGKQIISGEPVVIINLEKMLEYENISENDLKLFKFVNSVDEAFSTLKTELRARFSDQKKFWYL